MTREDIWSILRSNLAKSSRNHHVSAFLGPQTLCHGLLRHCTRHKAQGSLLLECAALPGAHTCWTATPASWFILSIAARVVRPCVGWPVLYCQQSKQLPWARCLHALSLGSPFSLEWFFGTQQCHLRWRRHSGPCLTRDYTKQALFYKRTVWGHSKGDGDLFHNFWKAGSGSHRERSGVHLGKCNFGVSTTGLGLGHSFGLIFPR